jgi:hypothetical protein
MYKWYTAKVIAEGGWIYPVLYNLKNSAWYGIHERLIYHCQVLEN